MEDFDSFRKIAFASCIDRNPSLFPRRGDYPSADDPAILSAPGEVHLLLLYLGIGCTAVNFALWYYGLKHTSAAAASAFQYMIPPTSVAIAALFLHEPISPTLGLGTLCILIGLLTTQIASARRRPVVPGSAR